MCIELDGDEAGYHTSCIDLDVTQPPRIQRIYTLGMGEWRVRVVRLDGRQLTQVLTVRSLSSGACEAARAQGRFC